MALLKRNNLQQYLVNVEYELTCSIHVHMVSGSLSFYSNNILYINLLRLC